MCRCVGVPVCQCIGVSMFEGGSIFMTHRDFRGLLKNVIPAKAGIHKSFKLLDPRFREDDKKCIFQQSHEHKNNLVEGFTKKYEVHLLVYFEEFHNIDEAITREKQLKRWKRAWKLRLIESSNPEWDD